MLRILTFIFVFVVSDLASAQLVGYWNFDGNVQDHSGTENHGELFAAEYTDNVPDVLGEGRALIFEDSGQYVHIPGNLSLNSSVFSVSFFANDQEQFTAINRFTSRQGDTFETGIDKHFGSDSLSFYSPQSGWNRSDVVMDLDEWHHVAYVADGENMTVYVDGVDEFGPSPFTAFPSGFMHIGNRWNNVEGFFGMMDDVSLWNVALDGDAIAALANGTKTPLTLEVEAPEPVPMPDYFTVGSSIETWMQSTETVDGGPNGEWDPSDVDELPGLDTYTLEPRRTDPGTMGHIDAAAAFLGVDGILGDSNVHFFRTTFELERTDMTSAELQLAVDNGALVYINGELIAEEISYLGENWNQPLPALSFDSDGAIEAVKFDDWANSFSNWVAGENEIVLAVRNPNEEGNPSGGFAFRLQIEFPEDTLLGDFNNDQVVDVADIDLLAMELMGERRLSFDVNKDGIVDQKDHGFLVTDVIGTWIGDTNLDGEFTSSDFVQVFQSGEYEDAGAFNSTWATGDWNGDKEFNSTDFVAAFQDGGFELGPRVAAMVPEPTGIGCLFVVAVLGVGRTRKRS